MKQLQFSFLPDVPPEIPPVSDFLFPPLDAQTETPWGGTLPTRSESHIVVGNRHVGLRFVQWLDAWGGLFQQKTLEPVFLGMIYDFNSYSMWRHLQRIAQAYRCAVHVIANPSSDPTNPQRCNQTSFDDASYGPHQSLRVKDSLLKYRLNTEVLLPLIRAEEFPDTESPIPAFLPTLLLPPMEGGTRIHSKFALLGYTDGYEVIPHIALLMSANWTNHGLGFSGAGHTNVAWNQLNFFLAVDDVRVVETLFLHWCDVAHSLLLAQTKNITRPTE